MHFILLALLLMGSSLEAAMSARIDIGPAYAKVDMLESNKTVRSLNLAAVKGDATIVVYEGLCIKPSFLLASGKANLNSASVGVGYCIPLPYKITLTPSVGVTETRFRSKLNLPDYGLFKLKERFVSQGQYVSLDISWTFIQDWRVYGMAQWCWSRVRTKINSFPSSRNHTQGPNYAIALEKDINKQFSVSLAAGYNLSLSKEKHGLRGVGVKLGLAYWWY